MTACTPTDLPSLAGAAWLAEPALQRLLGVLNAKGRVARVAGGAIRNALMSEDVADIDIATDLSPERVQELAEAAGFSVHPTGIAHGTVTVVASHEGKHRLFQVTTLRVDVETDGRRARVAFTDDWEADARRRDFTINALYCDASGKVFDPIGGYPDIPARRVRFVGDPDARIREDYLRILRFFRFHARYAGGPPDARGLAACIELKDGLARLSAERVRDELLKLLASPGVVATVQTMVETGILSRVLPGEAILGRLARMVASDRRVGLTPDPLLRLAALSPALEAFSLRLRLSNAEQARLAALADAPHLSPALREPARKVVLYRSGAEAFRDAVRLAWASGDETYETDAWMDLLTLPDRWSPPAFPVTGTDLIARGLAPGRELGETLRKLEDWWTASEFTADKAELLKRL